MTALERDRADRQLYARVWRAMHRESGLCIHCDTKATPAFMTCTFHRSYYTAKQRAHRAEAAHV